MSINLSLPPPLSTPTEILQEPNQDVDLGELAASLSISGDSNAIYYTSLAASKGDVCNLVSYCIYLTQGRSIPKQIDQAITSIESINRNFQAIKLLNNKQFQVMMQDLIMYLSEEVEEKKVYVAMLQFMIYISRSKINGWDFFSSIEDGVLDLTTRLLLNYIANDDDSTNDSNVGMFMSAYSFLFPKLPEKSTTVDDLSQKSILLLLTIFNQPKSPSLLTQFSKILATKNQTTMPPIHDLVLSKITE